MGIPYQTFNKYINGEHSCSIYNLVKIADYYGCSTDYLLGRTEIKSQEEDVRKVCEAIGFDEEVLDSLKSWSTHPSCCEYKPLVALIIKCLTKDSAEAIAQYCYSIFFKELLYKELLPFFKKKEKSQKGANYHISFLDYQCFNDIISKICTEFGFDSNLGNYIVEQKFKNIIEQIRFGDLPDSIKNQHKYRFSDENNDSIRLVFDKVYSDYYSKGMIQKNVIRSGKANNSLFHSKPLFNLPTSSAKSKKKHK